ncbi:hypothetical protein N9Z31_03545 [Pseudomonadales bacterium]|jgi:hypothetical protein|nr:hypothetical protein [Pseudomonadales bacterium]MDB4363215.1 hypothetical protein [Pseudomonadales bacterium]
MITAIEAKPMGRRIPSYYLLHYQMMKRHRKPLIIVVNRVVTAPAMNSINGWVLEQD